MAATFFLYYKSVPSFVHEFLSHKKFPKWFLFVTEYAKEHFLGIGNSLKLIQDIEGIKVSIATEHKVLTLEYFQKPFKTWQDR